MEKIKEVTTESKETNRKRIKELVRRINSEKPDFSLFEMDGIPRVPKPDYGCDLFVRRIHGQGFIVGIWFSGRKWHSICSLSTFREAKELCEKLEYRVPKDSIRHRIYDFFFLSDDLDYGLDRMAYGRVLRCLERLMLEGYIYIDEVKYSKINSMKGMGSKTMWLYGKLLHDAGLGHLIDG